MNRRRAIPGVLAPVLTLGAAVAAVAGCGNSGSANHVSPTPAPSHESTSAVGQSSHSAGRVAPSQGSQGGGPDQPDPRALRHPRVPAQMRTDPRLRPRAGDRNTTFVLSFRLRRNLGPHGHTRSYYGVIVSPLTGHPRHGCYGFGRYVLRGRRGQLVRVVIHPRGRLWCPGAYQASVYLTAKPYCPPSRHPAGAPHPCSTASYPARPTGWTYFSVR